MKESMRELAAQKSLREEALRSDAKAALRLREKEALRLQKLGVKKLIAQTQRKGASNQAVDFTGRINNRSYSNRHPIAGAMLGIAGFLGAIIGSLLMLAATVLFFWALISGVRWFWDHSLW